MHIRIKKKFTPDPQTWPIVPKQLFLPYDKIIPRAFLIFVAKRPLSDHRTGFYIMPSNNQILACPQLSCQTKILITDYLYFSLKKKKIQEAIKPGFYKEKKMTKPHL
jgi:hypothetical protein